MNSENLRVLRKKNKFSNKSYSLRYLENLLEAFQIYRFQKSGLKEQTFRKKKTTEDGIGLKEYTLSRRADSDQPCCPPGSESDILFITERVESKDRIMQFNMLNQNAEFGPVVEFVLH